MKTQLSKPARDKARYRLDPRSQRKRRPQRCCRCPCNDHAGLPRLLSLERLQGLDYRCYAVAIQVWTDGDAEHCIGQLFRERKIAPLPAVAGIGFGQVRRNRIMDKRSNSGLVQMFLQFITATMS